MDEAHACSASKSLFKRPPTTRKETSPDAEHAGTETLAADLLQN